MTHELVARCTGDPLDAKGEGDVFQHRLVPQRHDLVQKSHDVGTRQEFPQLTDPGGGIAEPRGEGHRRFRVGGVLEEGNLHSVTAKGENPSQKTDKGISPVTKSPSTQSVRPGAFCYMPYFFLKRSTRPAVSTSFCLPVKKG